MSADQPAGAYHRSMHVLVAAKVWHYWIGIAILLPALLAVVATIIGYLVKVTANRYPKQ